jgi:hypothetical protein
MPKAVNQSVSGEDWYAIPAALGFQVGIKAIRNALEKRTTFGELLDRNRP